MSWEEVGKQDRRTTGRFLAFEDGKTEVMRVLDETPHVTKVHKISQWVEKGGKREEVFRSVPATAHPDDNFILKNNATRYPEVRQFSLRVWSYKRDANGKVTPDGELKILQGGTTIFKALRALYEEHGHLNKFDITVARSGSGRTDTEYTVSASPFSQNVDVAKLYEVLAKDEALKWENVFPPVTNEEQQKMLKDAGLDVNYDPARALASSMPPEKALQTKFTFGKHKDKTVGELMVIDCSYVEWAAENVTSNDELAAACRVAVGHQSAINAGEEPVKQIEQPKTNAVEKLVAAKSDSDSAKKQLIERVSKLFDTDKRFEDTAEIVKAIKEASGGKTRVKELTIPQLEKLLSDITAGA
jgi:hypothetical protein